ncbi:perlucin-like protein [Mytilus edulis]|uniref:perlucin-like protein n=1 Tax=Mytilus edulis TaxID=6550 RepID=UPI0039F14AC6
MTEYKSLTVIFFTVVLCAISRTQAVQQSCVDDSRLTCDKTACNTDLKMFCKATCKLCSDCQTGWIKLHNSCYLFSTDRLNWYEASKYCQTHQANLVKVDNAEEQKFIMTHASPLGRNFWMGGSDDQSEGSWVWSADGSGLVYTNWYPNEPNNSDDSGENCLELSALYHWHWNDANCKKVLFQFICEKGAVGLQPIIG